MLEKKLLVDDKITAFAKKIYLLGVMLIKVSDRKKKTLCYGNFCLLGNVCCQ